MRFQLNFKSGKPVYLQVVDQVKAAAASGALRAGEPLPSIRPLAESLRLNRNTTSGGGALTRAISQSLGIDANRAEQFKRDFGLKEDKLEGQIPKAVKPVIDTLITEVKRSLDFYHDQPHARGEVREMIVCGGTAQMPELLSLMAGTLGLETKLGDPWANINFPAGIKDQLAELAPSFSVTVGLAMREA